MKHIVIFLNYTQSRLDNLVFRQFAAESLYRRNSSLLFLSKSLEERELRHEVSELRKKQDGNEDVTFHVCARLVRSREGESVVNTLMLIRRLFQADVSNHYPVFVYGEMPALDEADDAVRKSVWHNLVVINNAVADHLECRLLTNVYLYNEAAQKSLAEFIFSISHADISFDRLSSRMPVKQRDLFVSDEKSSVDFPPIFGGFNTASLSYPEYDLRVHLHHYFLYSALRYSLPEVNKTNIEVCNAEAQRILSFIPLQTQRLCLQEEMFLNLNCDDKTQWQRAEQFWEENVRTQMLGLSEYPREEWLVKIRQRVDMLYRSRFRDIGVEYFFSLENKKMSDYCNVLKTIIVQEYERTIENSIFTPDSHKTIVRAIVNVLQQKVIEIQNLKAETLEAAQHSELDLNDIKNRWRGLNFINRLMGKDTQVLEAYRETLTRLMIKKTLLMGCDFAIRMLNELIPAISSMIERSEEIQRLFNDALKIAEKTVNESNPSDKFAIFGGKELSQTLIAIESDEESLKAEYQSIMLNILEHGNVTDGNELVSMVRSRIGATVDDYLTRRIEDCSIPPILGMPIVERIDRSTSSIGGIVGYVDTMKRMAPISIGIKNSCKSESKYFVISSDIDKIEGVEHLRTEDISHLQLLHVRYGLTLQDLDGFAGQRMFVEPSIF